MNKINLHTHSKYSLDGTKNINDIINICFNNGIVYLAVTDHNNCDTYKDLDLNKIAKHGTLVYGMEADAIINNVTYDILCLGFEPSKVREWAHKQYGTILSRQTKIYNKLVEISNNLDLVLNSVAYVSEKEDAITVRKNVETTYYTATETQDKVIKAIIFGLPVLIVLVGIVVWQLRRRKK